MTHDYAWADNKFKLQRAIDETRGGSEEAVKKKYIEFGGRIVDTTKEKVEKTEPVIPSSKKVVQTVVGNDFKQPEDEAEAEELLPDEEPTQEELNNLDEDDSTISESLEAKEKASKSRKSAFDS